MSVIDVNVISCWVEPDAAQKCLLVLSYFLIEFLFYFKFGVDNSSYITMVYIYVNVDSAFNSVFFKFFIMIPFR